MKIAITGAHGTGKTTLINAVKSHLDNYKIFTNITRSLRDQGYKINEEGNSKTQLKLLDIMEENSKLNGDILYDRCILDTLCYTHFLYLQGNLDKSVLDEYLSKLESTIKNYDVIFYLEPEFDIVDDNVRSTNILFRNTVVFLFQYYIEKYNIPVIKLTGSVKERVNQLLSKI